MAKTENHIYRVDPDGFMIFMSHSYRILLPVQKSRRSRSPDWFF